MTVTLSPPGTSAPFVIESHEGISVVRDDLLRGGSKTRFLPHLIPAGTREVVFGGPFCGGAPVALASLGARLGVQVTLFYAKRARLHPRQQLAQEWGARLFLVPYGYMTNVQAKARAYAAERGALFLPLGFDTPEAEDPFVEEITKARRLLAHAVDEVWCATGSGMLARCLGRAFPDVRVVGVAVGLESRWRAQAFPPNVTLAAAPYRFAQEARSQAPFPCCPNYDRKAWEACLRAGRGRRLFWNVMG